MATVVAFHAHPDDEVLLTGGTLARLAAEGHRVVIVAATDGIMGPATGPGTGGGPGARDRLAELRASAAQLGAARVVHLGYADSGHGPLLYPDPPDRPRFARADPAGAAARLTAVIREEHADLLLSYDPRGGYGHRDHIRVHEVGARAAAQCGIRVWEATLPRELVLPFFTVLRLLRVIGRYDGPVIRAAFTPRSAITHRVSVRRYAAPKRAALAAHQSFVRDRPGRAGRLARAMVALPVPVFGLLFGREWFAEPARLSPGSPHKCRRSRRGCGPATAAGRPRAPGGSAPRGGARPGTAGRNTE